MTFQEPLRSKFIAELERRTYKDPTCGCFIWNGPLYTNGYGKISISRLQLGVHRLAMALFENFDLDNDAIVCHKLSCSTKSCWNPYHLYIGNPKENALDRYQKEGRLRQQRELYRLWS